LSDVNLIHVSINAGSQADIPGNPSFIASLAATWKAWSGTQAGPRDCG
jgi:hypothetical protein